MPQQIFLDVSCNSYGAILARLNLSTFYFRRRNLDALFRINVFKLKLVVLPYLILLAY